ncbi:MAG TPA: DUF6580 family putative transport protein [Rhodanobacteraceae bacterium]|nr:DUF6580 family putative transport protein [Rhodanobacteraceae bacterium]
MLRTHESALFTPRNLVLCAMIAFAAGYRLLVHFAAGALPWNFTPVEAMALFGGAYFADRRLGVVVPLIAMIAADCVIAVTLPGALVRDWLGTLPFVYGCIALTAVGGFALRKKVSAPRVLLGALTSAVLFFLITNFGTWVAARPGAGAACTGTLTACYVAGIPFFKGTLYGTLFWSALLFGGFALLGRRWPALRTVAA